MLTVAEERRRAFVAAYSQREEKRRQLLARLEVGAVVLGRVSAVTEYGAFIDVGGIDGLLHVTSLGEHPANRFQVGDEVEVVVIKLDREQERILLDLPR